MADIRWPEGTVRLPFEDLDGVTLLQATVTGSDGRDTSGAFVLDTGAGFIALDESLAGLLGLSPNSPRGEMDFTRSPLPRLRLGDLDVEQAQTIAFDAGVIRDVTDRAVLGLIGQQPMNDRALWIDYQAHCIALIPAGPGRPQDPPSAFESRSLVQGSVSPAAVPLPFRIAAGGKVLVQVRVTPRRGLPSHWLTFVLDTGATKCAMFVRGNRNDPTSGWRPAIHALETPTLMGRSTASLIRAERVEVRGIGSIEDSPAYGDPVTKRQATAPDVDVLLVDSPLGQELSRVTGETVSGLLGYSFLRRFRVVCDYPHRVLWLDPVIGFQEDRPFEHSHPGIQLERREGAVRVMSVARPSPAERAGIRPGDEVIEVDRVHAAEASLADLGRLMEGRPGTVVSLTIRRGERETSYRLRRQRLL